MPRGRKKKIVLPAENPAEVETKDSVKHSKGLQLALKTLEKKFGKGIIKSGKSDDLIISRILTGIKSLDEALGGGFPIGMITELYGIESGGKSTIVAKLIANAQKQGLVCAYIDAEKALEEVWLKKLGVNIDTLLHNQLTDADRVFDVTKMLVQSAGVKLLVVDSIAALTPSSEIEEDMQKLSMAKLAKIVNKGLRVINTVNNRQGVAIVFINQLRDSMARFGNPTTTTGGKGMRYFAGIRVNVKRGEWYPNRKDRIGQEVVCLIDKNKTAVPYTGARFVLMRTGEIKEWHELRGLKKKDEIDILEGK